MYTVDVNLTVVQKQYADLLCTSVTFDAAELSQLYVAPISQTITVWHACILIDFTVLVSLAKSSIGGLSLQDDYGIPCTIKHPPMFRPELLGSVQSLIVSVQRALHGSEYLPRLRVDRELRASSRKKSRLAHKLSRSRNENGRGLRKLNKLSLGDLDLIERRDKRMIQRFVSSPACLSLTEHCSNFIRDIVMCQARVSYNLRN